MRSRRILDSSSIYTFGPPSYISFTIEWFVDVRDIACLHVLGLTSLAPSSPGVRFWREEFDNKRGAVLLGGSWIRLEESVRDTLQRA